MSRGTQGHNVAQAVTVSYGALTRSGAVSHQLRLTSQTTARRTLAHAGRYALQPHQREVSPTPLVWARPGSLAATTGVSFDFSSSGY